MAFDGKNRVVRLSREHREGEISPEIDTFWNEIPVTFCEIGSQVIPLNSHGDFSEFHDFR